jgi:hypothetical protein
MDQGARASLFGAVEERHWLGEIVGEQQDLVTAHPGQIPAAAAGQRDRRSSERND